MSISAQDMAARRAVYMSAKGEAQATAHQEYYQWLAESIGIGPSMLPPGHATSVDPHFNDVPLHLWDARHQWVLDNARHSFSGSEGKTFYWSLSDSVCCLKAIAQRERAKREQA